MLQIIVIGVVIWIVWKLVRAAARTATTQAYHQGAAESLDLPSAEAEHRAAELDFIGTAGDDHGLSNAELQSKLDKAVFLKDRVHQLSGKPHGTVFRATYRSELVTRVNRIRSANAGISTEPTYASFDEWLSVFKEGAGDANPTLSEKDNSSLIDFMDHTPLQRAYADGVEPYQLGTSFGEDFDFADFTDRQAT